MYTIRIREAKKKKNWRPSKLGVKCEKRGCEKAWKRARTLHTESCRWQKKKKLVGPLSVKKKKVLRRGKEIYLRKKRRLLYVHHQYKQRK